MIKLVGIANAEVRYSFGPQFLVGATIQADLANELEKLPINEITEDLKVAHRSYVASTIMQSAAGLEAVIWEVLHHGPGQHLGSNGNDLLQKSYLEPLAEILDREDPLSRYELVLHLLNKQKFDKSNQIWDNAQLVVKLRNEITHYKSLWGSQLDKQKLFGGLQSKRFSRPPWISEQNVNFFPHHCLSADCANWAVKSCVVFLNEFYRLLQVASPLETYRNSLPS